jgi:hypothetical protein
VRISGCVDDGLTGPGSIGITATGVNGIAYFLQHKENSIQYCWCASWQTLVCANVFQRCSG